MRARGLFDEGEETLGALKTLTDCETVGSTSDGEESTEELWWMTGVGDLKVVASLFGVGGLVRVGVGGLVGVGDLVGVASLVGGLMRVASLVGI